MFFFNVIVPVVRENKRKPYVFCTKSRREVAQTHSPFKWRQISEACIQSSPGILRILWWIRHFFQRKQERENRKRYTLLTRCVPSVWTQTTRPPEEFMRRKHHDVSLFNHEVLFPLRYLNLFFRYHHILCCEGKVDCVGDVSVRPSKYTKSRKGFCLFCFGKALNFKLQLYCLRRNKSSQWAKEGSWQSSLVLLLETGKTSSQIKEMASRRY